jgi:hypothetical protein
MRLVEQIKAGWVSWVFQGVPAMMSVIAGIIAMSIWYGHVNDRLDALETERGNTVKQMETLTGMINRQTNQIQQLQDRLEDKGAISYPHRKKKTISYETDLPSDFNPDLR